MFPVFISEVSSQNITHYSACRLDNKSAGTLYYPVEKVNIKSINNMLSSLYFEIIRETMRRLQIKSRYIGYL